ncbi:hypothetical protein, partial [Sphingomonas bacterium]|uniref:hypothetical protein n=1 Tax=Sphingomonas bacterium TaxID=1895847 RepID=UPI001C2D1793
MNDTTSGGSGTVWHDAALSRATGESPMPVRRSSRPFVFLALAAALAASACNKPGGDANDTAAANSSAPLPSLPATLPMVTGAPTAAAYAPP